MPSTLGSPLSHQPLEMASRTARSSPLALASRTSRPTATVTSPRSKHEVAYLLNESTAAVGKPPAVSRSGRAKRHKCGSCPSSFAQMADLRKHVRTVHEGLRPFACDICHKRFGEKGNLSKHKKSVHENERPFACSLCPAAFAFRDGLARHINVSWDLSAVEGHASLPSSSSSASQNLLTLAFFLHVF